MRIVLFYHSLVSDWNHGNAHFLRGILSELIARGHDVRVFEPRDGWSRSNLLLEHGRKPIREFHRAYPGLHSTEYSVEALDLDAALDGADLVIVHEWNSHRLVERIGRHRDRTGGYLLLFHDTHHRVVTDTESVAAYDLSNYDGALAFGDSLSEHYRRLRLASRVWTWHEAADTRVFHPVPAAAHERNDLVWIGNWGDDERTAELREFLLDPIRELGVKASAFGVRYPAIAIEALKEAGIDYRGWTPNYQVPEIYSGFRLTVHVPRRPYVAALPGVPTIRVFEALACGIPLICSPWNDCEGLFTPGEDFLVARSGDDMKRCIAALLSDQRLGRELAQHGLRTLLSRHTCSHRVDELLAIHRQLAGSSAVERHAGVAM